MHLCPSSKCLVSLIDWPPACEGCVSVKEMEPGSRMQTMKAMNDLMCSRPNWNTWDAAAIRPINLQRKPTWTRRPVLNWLRQVCNDWTCAGESKSTSRKVIYWRGNNTLFSRFTCNPGSSNVWVLSLDHQILWVCVCARTRVCVCTSDNNMSSQLCLWRFVFVFIYINVSYHFREYIIFTQVYFSG